MDPVISVVMPTYQHGGCLPHAIDDILGQTWRDLELIVVDDGSTDGSAEILARAASSDERMRVVTLAHGGLLGALQAGAAAATGASLGRMDADDRCDPSRLATQMAYLDAHTEVGVVDCRVRLGESEVTGDGMRRYVEWINSLEDAGDVRRQLFVESPLVHPMTLMRRAAYDAAGGYVDEDGPEDYSLWLRMAGAGWELGKLPEVLGVWSDPPGRFTRTAAVVAEDNIARLKARHLPRLHPPLREGVQIWGAGKEGKRMARLLTDQGVPVRRFFDLDPRKIGNRLLGAPVLHLDALPEHDLFTLVGIGVRAAKPLVRERMTALDRVEGAHWIFIA